MTEYIFSLTLDVKHPDVPFTVYKSINSSSGNLIQTLTRFQIELVRLLADLRFEEEMKGESDIPF